MKRTTKKICDVRCLRNHVTSESPCLADSSKEINPLWLLSSTFITIYCAVLCLFASSDVNLVILLNFCLHFHFPCYIRFILVIFPNFSRFSMRYINFIFGFTTVIFQMAGVVPTVGQIYKYCSRFYSLFTQLHEPQTLWRTLPDTWFDFDIGFKTNEHVCSGKKSKTRLKL